MKLKVEVEYIGKAPKFLSSEIEIDLDLLKSILERRKNQHIEHNWTFDLNDLKNTLHDEIYELYGDDYLPTDSLENSEDVDMVNLDELVDYFKYLI